MAESHSEETTRVNVKVDGEEFVLRGQTTRQHMRLLAKYVDEQIAEVRTMQPNLPRHRTAILALFNVADELHRLQQENAELMEVLEEAR